MATQPKSDDEQKKSEQQQRLDEETKSFSKLFMMQAELALHMYLSSLSAMFLVYPTFGMAIPKKLRTQVREAIKQAQGDLSQAKDLEAVVKVHTRLFGAALSACEELFVSWVRSLGEV